MTDGQSEALEGSPISPSWTSYANLMQRSNTLYNALREVQENLIAIRDSTESQEAKALTEEALSVIYLTMKITEGAAELERDDGL